MQLQDDVGEVEAKAGAEAEAEVEVGAEVTAAAAADGMSTNGGDHFQGTSQEKLEIRPRPSPHHLSLSLRQSEESVMTVGPAAQQ